MTRNRATATALVVAVLGLTACGQQSGSSVGGSSGSSVAGSVADADGDTGEGAGGGTAAGEPGVVRLEVGQSRPELDCPTDERSVMIADFAHGAEGARAPQDAIGDGVVEAGERLVVSPRGTRVWVLRADGTARMEVGLVHHAGWLLHTRTTCG